MAIQNLPRQTQGFPGVNLETYRAKWKGLSIDKLIEEAERLQDIYFTFANNPALENQMRLIIEDLQKYTQQRYAKEAEENKNKTLGI